jgi:hypothetical protein
MLTRSFLGYEIDLRYFKNYKDLGLNKGRGRNLTGTLSTFCAEQSLYF